MFHHPRSVFQEHDDVMGIMCFSCVHMGLICQILRSNPPTSLLCTTPRITSAFICLPKVVCVSPCLSLQQFSWDFICRWSEKNTLKFTRITKHSWSVRKWTRDTEEKEMTGNGGKGNVISVLVSKYFCLCVNVSVQKGAWWKYANADAKTWAHSFSHYRSGNKLQNLNSSWPERANLQ